MARDSREVLTRPAPPPWATVRYGEHAEHVADVRLPAAGGPGGQEDTGEYPMVVFLHGGFWRHEYDRTHTGPLAAALAEAGMVLVVPEYRRTGAPTGGWPGTLDDVVRAVHVLPGQVGELTRAAGVRVGGVVLAGHSAGGQLALWAAAETGVGAAVVALAPVADLARAYQLDLDSGAVAALLGGGPDVVPERYARADPMARLPLGCPHWLVHGDADRQVPMELSRRYADAAGQAGEQPTLTVLPGVDHFAVIDPLSVAWPVVLATFRSAGAVALTSGRSTDRDTGR